MVRDTRVAIAGGSLGGLTAGLLLRDLGLEVTIYERSPAELQQRGAGIAFLPSSYRYLVERGGRSLDHISLVTSRIRYLARSGAVTHDLQHAYRFSSWNTVYRELLACFGRARYHLGQEVSSFEEDADHVAIAFANGETDDVDLLVCADGVIPAAADTSSQRRWPGTPATSPGEAWRPSNRSTQRRAMR
jgi:2,6-dihydroxypyridine 3-monooxygenase